MFFWLSFIELLRVVLFALAHVCGGSLGGGILVLSLIVRLALLPLTLRIAIKAHAYQAIIRTIQPRLEALQKRHAKNPAKLAIETRELYAANGIGAAPKGTFAGTLIQLPLGVGVYQAIGAIAKRAVRFLWIGDLSRPDALVASVAAGLAGAAVAAGPSTGTSRVAAAVSAVTTFIIASRLSAGLGLYWVASNAVGVVQSLLLRRAVTRADNV
jgi:YidC/Oxa1 family membrane protein insertase